jgi:ribosomal protein L7/L12
MPILRIRIEPKSCGPVSVGTIAPVKVLREELGIRLAEAKEYIDRAVFGGEVVDIEVESTEIAESIAEKLNATPPPAKVVAEVVS